MLLVITGGQRVYGAVDFARAKVLRDHGYHPMVVLHDLDAAVWSQDKAPEWQVVSIVVNGVFRWPTCVPIVGPIWSGEKKGNPLLMGPFQKLYHKGPKCASALVLRGPSDVLIRDLPNEAVRLLLDAWRNYISFFQKMEEIVGESLFCFPRWEVLCLDEMVREISSYWGIPWTTFSKLPVEWGKCYYKYPRLYWRITPEGRRVEEHQALEGTLFPKRDMLIPELLCSGVSIATSTSLPYKEAVLRLLGLMEEKWLLPPQRGRWFGVTLRWTKARLIAERLVRWYGKHLPEDEVENWASFWETHPPAYVRPEDVEGEVVVMY
jgi:hypothetical protein